MFHFEAFGGIIFAINRQMAYRAKRLNLFWKWFQNHARGGQASG
jgi:hypothetical protein